MTKEIKEIINLEKNVSYEVRFYCDLCDTEIAEYDQLDHECEGLT